MSNNYSLSIRLQWIVAVLLVISLGLIGLVLDQTYQRSVKQEEREQLSLFFHSLLAETDCCAEGLRMPGVLRLPGLNQRDSGLYAKVLNDQGVSVWQSASAESVSYALERLSITMPVRGEQTVVRVNEGFEEPVLVASYTVGLGGQLDIKDYTFVLVHSVLPMARKMSLYRQNLWGWLAGCAIFLMVLQGLVLRWVLSPLRKVVADLYAIQDGMADQLPIDYPQELLRLTGTINELVDHEKRQRQRHRNSLADLAHSMKTPLAVLRSFAEGKQQQQASDMVEEVQRLDDMVSYQLQRAVIGGRKTIAAPVNVLDIAQMLKRTLDKVYLDKGVECSISIPEEDCFYGEKNDIFEILGNLIENAYKYTNSWVKVYSITDDVQRAKRLLAVIIEDDGPGIPDERKAQILSRGARLDTCEPGQGIGLAMVADVIDSYGGKITIESNTIGGARFVIVI